MKKENLLLNLEIAVILSTRLMVRYVSCIVKVNYRTTKGGPEPVLARTLWIRHCERPVTRLPLRRRSIPTEHPRRRRGRCQVLRKASLQRQPVAMATIHETLSIGWLDSHSTRHDIRMRHRLSSFVTFVKCAWRTSAVSPAAKRVLGRFELRREHGFEAVFWHKGLKL